MHKVFINGSSGTTGLRLRERLETRSDVELLTIKPELRRDENEIGRVMRQSDFCFLCLPDEAARSAAKLAISTGTRIIDASTAHRTRPDWDYGFPELSEERRSNIAKSDRVAIPGCHASGFIALVYPLRAAGLLPSNYPLSCTSVTGYSGGGKGMIDEYSGFGKPESFYSPKLYATSQCHKHLPEMLEICSLTHAPAFTPIVSNYYSGMLVYICLHTRLLDQRISVTRLYELYAKCYNRGLVHVLPSGFDGDLESEAMSGRDDMEIIVTGNDERVLLAARFDNLGKGASGAAIQCFNIMTGTDDIRGLISKRKE